MKIRVVFERLISPLDDRESWLKSVSDALLGYSLESIQDENEASFHSNLIGTIKSILSHKNLINRPADSVEISFTETNGNRVQRFISKASKKETNQLEQIISGLSSEQKLKLIGVILESENEATSWEVQ